MLEKNRCARPLPPGRRGVAGVAWIVVAAAMLAAVPGSLALAAAPTLTTITVDGNFGDWTAVLANPDNVYLDGPAGGRIDLDAPIDPVLNVDTFAFTWDATNFYVYIH